MKDHTDINQRCEKCNVKLVKYLVRNVCLALYSKKQIINVFEKYKDDYDYCIISRPDMEFKNEFNVDWLNELTHNNIIIPSKDSSHGINDRFCIGKPEVILFYGKLYDYLKEYSIKKSIISERYLLDMINDKKINIIKKNIEYIQIRIK